MRFSANDRTLLIAVAALATFVALWYVFLRKHGKDGFDDYDYYNDHEVDYGPIDYEDDAEDDWEDDAEDDAEDEAEDDYEDEAGEWEDDYEDDWEDDAEVSSVAYDEDN